MHRVILSAPFGNWLNFENCVSTLGTFTPKYRGGVLYRLWRMARTVRYYPGIGAWRNKLGLPNPGIDNCRSFCAEHILSVAAFDLDGWRYVLRKAFEREPLAVEMNVSCPNCPGEDKTNYSDAFTIATTLRNYSSPLSRLIVKLPPVGYVSIIRKAFDAGVSEFHCCNTLPTPSGGLSGKPLKALSLQAIADIKNYAHSKNYKIHNLIGGGGITGLSDARDYMRAGVDRVAIGSALFLPWKHRTVRHIASILSHVKRWPVVDNSESCQHTCE